MGLKISIAIFLIFFLMICCDADLNSLLFSEEGIITDEHLWSIGFSVDKEPSCTESGIESRHCEDEGCDKRTEITVIPPLGHNWEIISGGKKCKRCGLKEILSGEGTIRPVYTPDLPIRGKVAVTDYGTYALIGYEPDADSLLNCKLLFCNVVGIGNLSKNEDGLFVLDYREGKSFYTIKLTVSGKDESVTIETDFKRIS